MQEHFYTILVYDDHELGVWVKVPELGNFQALTDDWRLGLEAIGEEIEHRLEFRRRKGELVPERLLPRVRHVGRYEYGPTLIDLEERRRLRGLGGGCTGR
jgi:hypothetical protein